MEATLELEVALTREQVAVLVLVQVAVWVVLVLETRLQVAEVAEEEAGMLEEAEIVCFELTYILGYVREKE
tara:strand:- start:275 stop:487 length:213 start_codon:yes stop_codon:yes gene_type:complete